MENNQEPNDLPTNPSPRTKRDADLSDAFQYSRSAAAVADLLIEVEKNDPKALLTNFARYSKSLDDFNFWFLLSSVWARDNTIHSAEVWASHFMSERRGRKLGLMKRNEQKKLAKLPPMITVYWPDAPLTIAYTLDHDFAQKLAEDQGVRWLNRGTISKDKVIAYFDRRRPREVVILENETLTVDEIMVPLYLQGGFS